MLHKPVMLNEVMEAARQVSLPKSYLDCTLGRGGHMSEVLKAFPDLKVVAIDRDIEAIHYAKQEFRSLVDKNQLELVQTNFMTLSSSWKNTKYENLKFDIILADLGVSSPQLDKADRGFSFYNDGPLDMRMDQKQDLSAEQIVNDWSEEDLIVLFEKYGEIKNPTKVVKEILRARNERRIKTTLDLADLITSVTGWRKKGQHPATKYFMAIRIKVNEELDLLEEAIEDLIFRLSSGGRLIVITFHFAEDRIVKWKLKNMSSLGKIITKKVVQPKWAEKKQNPRSRSAQLRVFQRGEYNEKEYGNN